MASGNNNSDNGSNIPWWAKKLLWRLEAQGERHDTLIKLVRAEVAELKGISKKQGEAIERHGEAIEKLMAKSDSRDKILTDHAKAIKVLLQHLKK